MFKPEAKFTTSKETLYKVNFKGLCNLYRVDKLRLNKII